ncbi:MAG: hypothetical protein QOK35_1885 [Pseudonocardiales bacterium]|nr:hypothetical protein [Pseudonocardiales bacterium]
MRAPNLALVAPRLTAVSWSLVAVALLVLIVVTVLCVLRARRLDRLHRRTDAARAGLAEAMERRGRVALRVADAWATGPRTAGALALRVAAIDALTACRDGLGAAGAGLELCEVAENTLTRRLAAVDRDALPGGLAGELLEAEQLGLLSRSVYNDAVRDTLDLRSRRLVRWLRLAGTAAAPAYFEIADPSRRTPAPRPPLDVPPVPVPAPAVVPALGTDRGGTG